jgi:hypothetical protein
VAVALHDLGRGRGGFQAQFFAGDRLDLRVHARVGPDGAGDLSHGSDLPGVREPVQVTLHLEGPHRELVAKHGGFGVDPVRPPDHDRAPVPQSHLAELEG